jgi:hypothetical protein
MYLFGSVICVLQVFLEYFIVYSSQTWSSSILSLSLCFVFVPGTKDEEVHLSVGLRYM